jgi:hypothetical protein
MEFIELLSKEEFIKKISEATEKMFDIKDTQKMSNKAKTLLSIIEQSDFGCKKESVIKLVEAITGESIMPFYKSSSNLVLFACVVFTRDCSFDKGDICIIISLKNQELICFSSTDETYKYCDSDLTYKNIRKATLEEITEFADKLYK